MANLTMDKLVALAKNRGFVFPGSEIYGGLANTWVKIVDDANWQGIDET